MYISIKSLAVRCFHIVSDGLKRIRDREVVMGIDVQEMVE